MELHLPSSTSLLSVFGVDLADLARGQSDAAIGEVTPERVDQAVDAMVRGDLEYVGLHDGPTFVQAAGEGEGPYAIELHADGGDAYVHVPEGVTAEAVRYALQGFLRSDPAWPQAFPWQPAAIGGPPRRGGFFRRRRDG